MNAATDCHEIPGCPNLFVDAFRGRYLSNKSKDASNVLVLTHYHGDHYGNLPREHKYQGPAVIHCTPVTAALLRQVHQVPDHLVCEHKYGEAWEVPISASKKKEDVESSSNEEKVRPRRRTAVVTFYDANHCPGAAMVLVQVPSRNAKGSQRNDNEADIVIQHHLHTGDFRYHPRMQNYPKLQEAVRNRTLDCLFLDTTFAHPRHSFVPQSVAIETIASQVHELLSTPSSDEASLNTLVLLGCYSIGKERVLWEVAERTQQLVYVSESKLQKLECVALQGGEDLVENDDAEHDAAKSVSEATSPSHPQHHHRIFDRCTTDPNQSDVHVVSMGLAGEMWPYFQPRYDNCYEYAAKLDKSYRRVVAFVPTGWADGSKWNREHSHNKQLYKGVEVEIRLVPYSEHSSFHELEQFVAYCKPRMVVPTVFADDKDRRRIQSLFPIDTQRAKQHFFQGMDASSASMACATVTESGRAGSGDKAREVPMPQNDRKRKADLPAASSSADDGERHSDDAEQLVAMGFLREDIQKALTARKGSVEGAVEWLLGNQEQSRANARAKIHAEALEAPTVTPEASSPCRMSATDEATPAKPSKQAQKTLLQYFTRKL